MKKNKSKNFIIECEVYSFDLYISIGEDDKQFLNNIAKKLPPECLEELKEDPEIVIFGKTTLARAMMFDNGQLAIRFKRYPQSCRDYGNISHELFHVVDFLFHHLKMPLTPDTREAYAYLIGYITTKFYENL
jgi:hypothetical protein